MSTEVLNCCKAQDCDCDCSTINGTYTLNRLTKIAGCRWETTAGTIVLNLEGDNYTLTIIKSNNIVAQYEKAASQWDCCAPNEMALVFSRCETAPLFIVLNPNDVCCSSSSSSSVSSQASSVSSQSSSQQSSISSQSSASQQSSQSSSATPELCIPFIAGWQCINGTIVVTIRYFLIPPGSGVIVYDTFTTGLVPVVANIECNNGSVLYTTNYLYIPPGSSIVITDNCSSSSSSTSSASSASNIVPTTCCPGRLLPTVLYVHFSGGTGGCTCLNGVVVPVVWNGVIAWVATFNACGHTNVDLTLSCNQLSRNWGLVSAVGGINTTLTGTCDPFVLSATNQAASGLCAGTVNITVTEFP